MSTEHSRDQRGTGVREKFIHLGIDGIGASHCFRTVDMTIHVIQDGRREFVQDVSYRHVDDWIRYVAARRGEWQCRDYALGFGEVVDRAGSD